MVVGGIGEDVYRCEPQVSRVDWGEVGKYKG